MEQKFHYTNERNVQIVIALLKAHGIHRVIASPGTTNMTFVVSVQNDPWFQVWSSVDERSAAYLACGMASETGEPVVISCTGATASRNYMPGLTEAYYRKLPILAITSTRGNHQIGHLIDQQIDRRTIPNDIAVESVTIPNVKDNVDEHFCMIEANKAILALSLNGGGPSHMNMYTTYSRDFSIKELPPVNIIRRYTMGDNFPEIPQDKRIAISVGSHQPFTKRQTEAIERFCATYDAVVFCDHTSNYYGKYKVNLQLAFGQKNWTSGLASVDICIHIGEVSGDQFRVNPKNVWRVSPDGALRDTFKELRNVFMMPEEIFFESYSKDDGCKTAYWEKCKNIYQMVLSNLPELPFGNIWMAQNMFEKLPVGCDFHMGIYNSLRSWNFFKLPGGVTSRCNVGGFGIDGGVSTLIGAAIARPDKLHIGVFGDLAFFYDMNVIGNKHVGDNIRIMLINNGRGTEFRNYNHPCYFLGNEADKFVAAAGHYGNKSSELIKHYATDLGYEYLTASNKEEFMSVIDRFLTPQPIQSPIILEVFTNTEDESDALEIALNYMTNTKGLIKKVAKSSIKALMGEDGIEKVKKMIR